MADRGSFLTGLRRAGKLAGCAPHGSAVNERREYMSEPANQTIRDMIERRSCRSFKSDMVPHETVEKIIEAGLYAASGREIIIILLRLLLTAILSTLHLHSIL